MFVNVALKVPMGEQLVIPASGVLQSGTRQIAFVDRGDGYLEPREVQLGPRVGDDFIVLKGLKEGEQIVTSANFLIDSESQLQAALGSFAPPPPGAGQATAMNAPKANAELTSQPEPAAQGKQRFPREADRREGRSRFRRASHRDVLHGGDARDGNGRHATPTSSVRDKGNGLYEGPGQLASGGTWQVTIIAQEERPDHRQQATQRQRDGRDVA